MALQLWFADVLRKAGLTVHEVPGWRTRTEGSTDEERRRSAELFAPRGVIIHETRGSATSTDAGEIGVLVNGRVGLSGPIAQLYLSRTGEWWVVAAGLCHHVRTGWGGPFTGLGNSRLLGIEPAHAESESWTAKPAQYRSYVRGVAAILRHTGWRPPVGHKEHQPGDKPDPEFNMNIFRADVARAIAGGDDVSEFAATPNEQQPWALTQGTAGYVGQQRDTALAFAWQAASDANRKVDELLTLTKMIAAKVDVDPAELAAITAAARAGAEQGLASGADVLAERIAERLVLAEDNPLGDADKPAIVAAVKQALTEGTD